MLGLPQCGRTHLLCPTLAEVWDGQWDRAASPRHAHFGAPHAASSTRDLQSLLCKKWEEIFSVSISGRCFPSHPINTLTGVLVVHCKKLGSPRGHGPKHCYRAQPHPPVPRPSPAAAGSPRKLCSSLGRDGKGFVPWRDLFCFFKRLHRNSLNSLKLKDLKPTTEKIGKVGTLPKLNSLYFSIS